MDAHFNQLRPDLTIHQAEIFQTNTGILKTQHGFILVDPAFTQADLERIATFCQPYPILAGFSTHAHYDHLFWSPLFGDETPRYCSEGTLEYCALHQQEILNDLNAQADGLYFDNLKYFIGNLSHLSGIILGLNNLNDILIEVIDIPGHLTGQTAFLFPDFQTLFVADTLSDIEPPSIEGSRQSLLDYLESLEKLESLIRRVSWVVPGHGQIADPSEAQSRLQMDRRYLQALLAVRAEDLTGSLEILAKAFLERIHETRVKTGDSWQIHLQNLDFARNWFKDPRPRINTEGEAFTIP